MLEMDALRNAASKLAGSAMSLFCRKVHMLPGNISTRMCARVCVRAKIKHCQRLMPTIVGSWQAIGRASAQSSVETARKKMMRRAMISTVSQMTVALR